MDAADTPHHTCVPRYLPTYKHPQPSTQNPVSPQQSRIHNIHMAPSTQKQKPNKSTSPVPAQPRQSQKYPNPSAPDPAPITNLTSKVLILTPSPPPSPARLQPLPLSPLSTPSPYGPTKEKRNPTNALHKRHPSSQACNGFFPGQCTVETTRE